MQKLKLAYFGSPQSSASFLQRMMLDKDLPIELNLVVTQPDKKVGRKQILTPTPVKLMAQKYNIPVIDNLHSLDATGQNLLHDTDLALLIFFGKIIPKQLLDSPRYGFWNIHFSDLPRYRGGFPFVYSLLMGDADLKISLFQMDEKLDHGSIIDQQKIKVNINERTPELEKRCTEVGYALFKQNVHKLLANTISFTPQDENRATYTQLLKRDHGFIPLPILQKALHNEPLTEAEIPILIKEYHQKNHLAHRAGNESGKIIYNYFRGLYPWPGIWTTIDIQVAGEGVITRRLKITDMDYENSQLIIKKVQLEGKRETDFITFNRTYQLF